ncbi:MAG: acyl-CoA dehydrogenase family protein [Actinobacteria bacterium]|nr:acyl-CoA dehydrogenase family protein [Actinomycetota bacterium]
MSAVTGQASGAVEDGPGISFQLSDEIVMLRELVRGFVERYLIPIEMTVPEGESAPDEIVRPLQEEARKLDLWLLTVPQELGGMGLGLLEECIVQEELGKSKALPYRNNEVFGPYIDAMLLEGCNEDQKERFVMPLVRGEKRMCFALSEPDFGSDPSGLKSRALRDGDHFVLNGTKRFISNGDTSDFALVFCRTDREKTDRGGISAFMVDLRSPGVSISQRWPTMMGDVPSDISFDDVRVPAADLLGKEGEGFAIGQRSLTGARISSQAAWAVGVAQRSLDLAIEYVTDRSTFGQPLSERQAIQFMIADSAIELRTARLLLYETAARFDRGEDIRNESYMTKIYCVEVGSRIVDRAIQILGGIGLTTELPLEYFYRQIRSLRITEGTTEVLRWRLARNLIRHGAR